MRILFLSPRLCLPLLSGARLREYYLARALGRRAEVTYLSFLPPGFERPAAADLSFFRDVHLVPLAARYSPLKLVRGLVGRWPVTVVNYTTPAMKSALAGIVAQRRFDLVHVDGSPMAAYVPFLESIFPAPVRAVYDWHNIDSEVLRRYSGNVASWPRKIYAAATARRLAAMETQMLRTGFGHAVCSERERRQLAALAPDARIAVIENGVDTEFFAGTAAAAGVGQRLVFVGSMDYYPNIEAVVCFATDIWPRIREKFPAWCFTIVGSNPAPAVLALRAHPGVEVTGTVADVRAYYRDAVAAVVPLLTGGGTRLKILEAMAAGVPVLSTSVGAEGLVITPGKDILLVDDGDAWLPALVSLSGADGRRRSIVESALRLVRSQYDWNMLGERLWDAYSGWLGDGAATSPHR